MFFFLNIDSNTAHLFPVASNKNTLLLMWRNSILVTVLLDIRWHSSTCHIKSHEFINNHQSSTFAKQSLVGCGQVLKLCHKKNTATSFSALALFVHTLVRSSRSHQTKNKQYYTDTKAGLNSFWCNRTEKMRGECEKGNMAHALFFISQMLAIAALSIISSLFLPFCPSIHFLSLSTV